MSPFGETAQQLARSNVLLTPKSHRIADARFSALSNDQIARLQIPAISLVRREENSKWNNAYLRRQSENNESTKGCFRSYELL